MVTWDEFVKWVAEHPNVKIVDIFPDISFDVGDIKDVGSVDTTFGELELTGVGTDICYCFFLNHLKINRFFRNAWKANFIVHYWKQYDGFAEYTPLTIHHKIALLTYRKNDLV